MWGKNKNKKPLIYPAPLSFKLPAKVGRSRNEAHIANNLHCGIFHCTCKSGCREDETLSLGKPSRRFSDNIVPRVKKLEVRWCSIEAQEYIMQMHGKC